MPPRRSPDGDGGAPATGPGRPLVIPHALPRGRAGLPRDIVLASQRHRLVVGIVEAVAEKGYAATTVADVIRRAGVSRSTFYEQFADKEDCFLAAYEEGVDAHFAQMAAAAERADDWLGRMRAGVRAWLDVLEAEPAWARCFVLEIVAVGPAALERRAATLRRYAELVRGWYEGARAELPELPALPDEVFEAAVAAGNELLVARMAAGADLAGLDALVLYVNLSVFGLPEVARAELERA